MAPVDNSELQRLRGLHALEVLDRLATHVKLDRDFAPRAATLTQRVHVNAAGADWELLVEGPRFYDTRKREGGGGAIDLVMHLWQVPFKKAVAILRNAEV